MNSSNTSNTFPNNDHLAWQFLTSFSLSGGLADQELLIAQVVTAVQELNWPPTNLAQLKLAVRQAIQNLLGRGPPIDSLEVRVLLRVEKDTAAGDEPIESIAGRCWGFFLVQRGADDASLKAGTFRPVIELYLFQE